jgi:putative ABC transport system permease protein
MRFFRRRDTDEELREEINSHLELRAELNRESGMSPEAARGAAQRQFGNTTSIYEEVRRMHVNQFLETVAQDFRYALRGLRRNPAFALSAILALALGIGGATAVFSAVDRILFRALPYRAPDRLVSVGIMTPLDTSEMMFSASYLDWQRRQSPFERMTSFGGVADCDLTEGTPVSLGCAQVEWNFLPTFGIQPLLGRNFAPEEDVPNGPRVALIAYGLWQSRFASDPRIYGKAVSLNGAPTTIVGVLPAAFELPRLNRADFLVPLQLARALPPGSPGRDIRAFARLKPGLTIGQAHAALEPLFAQFLPTVPAPFRKQVFLRVRSVRDLQTQDSRLASWLLMGAVAALLLIACANVANLMLARAARRHREMAVRAAIGASRARIVRQTLTESIVLAVIGGVAGCGLALVLIRVFIALAPAGIMRLAQARLDWRALVFALGVVLCSGILFGMAPAFDSRRGETLTGSRQVGAGRGLFREALVVAQIAISLVLLSGATLLLRSLWNLENVPLGFDRDRAIAASFVLGPARYATAQRQQEFYESLEARIAQIPGVATAAIPDTLPPSGRVRAMPYTAIQAEGHPRYTQDTGGMVAWRFVTPGYFAALGVPILNGLGFTEGDRDASGNAVVLSQSLARRLFPAQEPLGRGVRFGEGEPWYTVVGIAADVKNSGVAVEPGPEYYLVRRHGKDPVYAAQILPFGWRSASIAIRTSMSEGAAASALRAAVGEIDSTVPVYVESVRHRVSALAARPRFDAALLALFAAMGLLLASIGLYGVMAFLVAQRTQEIGVRMAIGASPAAIAGMVLGSAARWTVAGAILGIIGSLAAAQALKSILFGVAAHDVLALAGSAGVLIVVALLAVWLPARRAAAVDPVTALRVE